ncbi:Dehydrodolichyl diphosphate synthase complex subunit DHDDS [Frankliniella fusca]|uniref:Alkyl transferase n=1 Tax=Frankliniella fusca TaxID=407009 RepID=A0AAE1H2L0_9NEOP|nr:Dehydrodolichyl diphosphate synthase complex subunit DHDDS [Frankliniella fusca]
MKRCLLKTIRFFIDKNKNQYITMSWISDHRLSWAQKLGVRIIGSGHIPKHVAFIMDGNRRFARKHNVQKIEGHSKGFDRLSETLNWCLELGIKEVTVYAFSIENFKRSQEEVDGLMNLARQKFERLLDEKDKLMEHGVHIRVIGNLNLLPLDLRKVMAKAMLMTKENSKAILNIAFAYTGREEILRGVQETADGVSNGILTPADITQDFLSKTFYSNNSPIPDLLIRTSGEVRLSDFLLWQVSCSCIYLTDVLWPDFTVWDFLSAVFYYQRCHQKLKNVQQIEKECGELNQRVVAEDFIMKLNNKREMCLAQWAN